MQDSTSGNITYTWQDYSTRWLASSTASVFDGADVGGLACVTAAATCDRHGDAPLEVADDMNKCCFFVGERIKEGPWDGRSWSDGGSIRWRTGDIFIPTSTLRLTQTLTRYHEKNSYVRLRSENVNHHTLHRIPEDSSPLRVLPRRKPRSWRLLPSFPAGPSPSSKVKA